MCVVGTGTEVTDNWVVLSVARMRMRVKVERRKTVTS